MQDGLNDFIRDIHGSGLTLLEVGSYAGESASMFAESGKFMSVVCVDPWGTGCPKYKKQAELAEVEFDKAVQRHHPVIIKRKGVLRDFVDSETHVDVCYIDGKHDYRSVLRDVYQAMLFLKPGGIMAGHDYNKDHPGVMKAVDTIYGRGSFKVYKDGTWAVFERAIR